MEALLSANTSSPIQNRLGIFTSSSHLVEKNFLKEKRVVGRLDSALNSMHKANVLSINVGKVLVKDVVPHTATFVHFRGLTSGTSLLVAKVLDLIFCEECGCVTTLGPDVVGTESNP